MVMSSPCVTLSGSGVLMLTLLGCGRSPATGAERATVLERADVVELYSVLDGLARAWRPSDHARLIQSLRPRAEELTEAIVWVLADPRHPRFAATVQLAGDLRVKAARAVLAALVERGPDHVVGPAMAAAEAIEAWSAEALAGLLHAGTSVQKAAALRICRERADRPVAAIEALLGDGDDAVRNCAIAALGDRVSDGALRDLVALADEEVSAKDARGALRRMETSAEQRAQLLRLAVHAAPETRLVIATVCGLQEDDAAALAWSLAAGGDGGLRVAAVASLDASGSTDVARLVEVMPGLPPAGLFHVARCLVRAGERDGIRLLLELADAPSVEAQSAARCLLAELSGIPAAGTSDAWRAWCAGVSLHDLEALARKLGRGLVDARSVGSAR